MISEYMMKQLIECAQVLKAHFGTEAIRDGRFKEWVAVQELTIIVEALRQEVKYEKNR